jgi:hypothetical protein
VTRLSSHGPRARAEFRRLVLESRIGVTQSELAARKSLHQRIRVRRVERRLAELQGQLAELDGPRSQPRSRLTLHAAGYLVSAVWLVGAALLAVQLARHGLDTAAGTAGILVMLLVSLVWFALAIARIPLSAEAPEDESPRPAPHA